ncbi:sugar-binding domain-containing protein [Hyunsoonleella pacifica]|uniref:Glycoside hydrolase family 2 n=1 Tax=Hyunsoonleella pacifica TaxID=1080224 RepID=A0A4V2JBC1_9FLAO|nr:sugar-binding domain-containing protein [Hyunsoonleella pacifica]TBN18671.1 glycoside hydrolase family 2 [Hyunsoonleella pacifica]GGD03695.1 beta-galactosidase [Hyunsoonleella pacifica]
MRLFQTVIIIATLVLSACATPKVEQIDLSGDWQVKLDSTNIGVEENWASSKIEGTIIQLPGTLDDAGLGTPNTLEPAINNYVMSNLARKHQYIGKAWYQKEIEVPSNWEGDVITLSLERVLWESTIYIDGKKVGSANSLIGTHDFELKDLSTGKHTLTITIDNSNKFPDINVAGTKYPDKVNQDMAHAYTNHTQIKWNGILGDIVLKATNKSQPSNVQVYPNQGLDKIKLTFNQPTSEENPVELVIKTVDGSTVYSEKVKASNSNNNLYTLEIEKPEGVELWDEFNPNLYDVFVTTSTGTAKTRFGYKFVANDNGNLALNGTRIFLRGNLECVIFPLTGYPPTKKEDWAKIIGQAKNYGLNHLRFHSWCPPKTAFQAADEAGFYLQVELPHWSLKFGEDANTVEFLKSEAHKIIKDYGNHPSFIFMAMGNELEGDMAQLNSLVAELKPKDNRHLYATTAFSFQRPAGTRPEPEDEFFIAQWTKNGWIRGQGVFNNKPPHFNADFTAGAEFVEIPLVSHEIGQYSVYPDMSEIDKYTGLLQPLNFIAVKNDLEKKGLLDLAPDFTYNSGKLASILYKEEIERAMKTPSFDGFQLLQLQDFPGQGTALVGLLNAFWESKGVISAEEFRMFNSELVPLLRFEKAVYENGETFKALIEVANFFKPMNSQAISWRIVDEADNVLANSKIQDVNLAIGNNTNLGEITFDVNTDTAKKLKVEVNLEGTNYKNSWNIWVYPTNVNLSKKDIVVTSSYAVAEQVLNKGGKVLLNPDFKTLKGIEGRFVPVFWSPVHFPNQPATMGILVDDKHPALKSFPTDTHSDWQWWDLCINSKTIITDSLNVTPIVRLIDNFVTNHHLASVFEAKVGNGTLVFSSIDLMSNLNKRPVARQLRHSLLEYMDSDTFSPSESVTIDALKGIELDKKQGKFSTEDIYK